MRLAAVAALLVACGAPPGGLSDDPRADGGPPQTGDSRIPGDPVDAAQDAGQLPAPGFTDVTLAAGITHLQQAAPPDPADCPVVDGERPMCMPRKTGGAAAGDFDGDGWVDLYVTRWDAADLLYRNNGDGTFSDVAAAAGLGEPLRGNGAGWADIDNDGDLDLYVTTIGGPRFHLFINHLAQGGGAWFTEEAVARGADVTRPGMRQGFSVSFGDYDRDGWLDLHLSEWRGGFAEPGDAASRLLRNRGAAAPGHFEDVTDAAGVAMAVPGVADGTWSVYSYASAFTDLDGDGWPDLVVAADFGTSRLFWNQGDGTFVDGTAAAGVGIESNGMGSALGDYDGDGWTDWFVTSIYPDVGPPPIGNRLYRYAGNRSFADDTLAQGVADGDWGWAAAFLDHDNDCDLDLVMTNGMLSDDPASPWADDPMRLWRNDAGSYTEAAAATGVVDTRAGKGMLLLDYDRDGDQDLFVANTAGPPVLYRNDAGNQHGWLQLRLAGTASPRQPLGARVTVTVTPDGPVLVGELRGGNNFLGQDEPVLHFGLGDGTEPVHQVAVRWPRTGAVTVIDGVDRNAVIDVAEP